MRRTRAVCACLLALAVLGPGAGCWSAGRGGPDGPPSTLIRGQAPRRSTEGGFAQGAAASRGRGEGQKAATSRDGPFYPDGWRKDGDGPVRPASAEREQERSILPPPTPVPANQKVPPAVATAPHGPGTTHAGTPPAGTPPAGASPAGGHPPGASPTSPGGTGDPHQRAAPTAYGSVLQLPPGKGPIEKALELASRLEAVQADNLAIKERLRGLEESVQARDRLINNATRDIQDATAEVARVRRDLQKWAEDLAQQQARLRQLDRDHQELLRLVVRTLEKAVGPEGASKPPGPP